MNILSFSSIADQIKKEINHKCGLNLSQTRILLFFAQNKNQDLNMGQLATQLHISLSTLSRQLQQKKTNSLIEITKSKKDSSKNIHLNELGLQKVNELKQELGLLHKTIFNFWDKGELELFEAQLAMIAKKLESSESVK